MRSRGDCPRGITRRTETTTLGRFSGVRRERLPSVVRTVDAAKGDFGHSRKTFAKRFGALDPTHGKKLVLSPAGLPLQLDFGGGWVSLTAPHVDRWRAGRHRARKTGGGMKYDLLVSTGITL